MSDPTARERANNIMDEACLPEFLIMNGVDTVLRDSITAAIEAAVLAELEACAEIQDARVEELEARLSNPLRNPAMYGDDSIRQIEAARAADRIRARTPTETPT